jgi:hypothetical protein
VGAGAESPRPSAVKYAVAVGGATGGLLLLLGLLVVLPVGALLLADGHFAGQAANVSAFLVFLGALVLTAAVCNGLIALAEGHAMLRIDERRRPWSLAVVALAGCLAALFAAGNVAWAAGVTVSGPTVAPTRALQLLQGDLLWRAVSTCAVGPTVVAALRAARSFATPGRTLLVLAALVGGLLAWEADLRMIALSLGGLYLAAALLGRRWVPAPPPPGSVPLSRLLGPFGDAASLGPLAVAGLAVAAAGQAGAIASLALVLLLAWHVKRRFLRECPRALVLQEAQAPPTWFSLASWAALEVELGQRGLLLAGEALHPALTGAGVMAFARGAGPTAALVHQDAPAQDGRPLAPPALTLVTCFDGDRRVVTTGRPLNGVHWLLRSPGTVLDAWPDAPLDLLFERHGRDVEALQALAGRPAAPGDAHAWLLHEASLWPDALRRLERVPAPWLLACAWWFSAGRPVRLRGPLPR